MKKFKLFFLSGVLSVACLSPMFVHAYSIIDHGSEANIAGTFKYVYAYTKTNGGPARAKVVIGGSQSDKTLTGWAQTNQLSAWYTNTAYIGHGQGGRCTICYNK